MVRVLGARAKIHGIIIWKPESDWYCILNPIVIDCYYEKYVHLEIER